MAAEHEGASRGTAFEHADRVRSSGRNLPGFDVESDTTHLGSDGTGDLRLAGRARHERRVDGVNRDQVAEQPNRGIHEGSSLRYARRRRVRELKKL